MAKILAIDYGTKRVGIAVTDSLQIIASALTTVHSSELINFLKKYIQDNDVECIVVGLPRNTDYSKSDVEKQIKPLVKHIQRTFPEILVEREDERFTSKLAFQSMIDSGVKKKDRRNKEMVDMVSATIILQSYLERKKSK